MAGPQVPLDAAAIAAKYGGAALAPEPAAEPTTDAAALAAKFGGVALDARQPPIMVDRGFTDPASVSVTNPAPVVRPVAPVAPVGPATYTRGRFTGLPGHDVTSATPEPLTEGVQQAAGGVAALGRLVAQPAVVPTEPHVTGASAPGTDVALYNAGSDILEGAAKIGTPLAVAGAIVALPETLGTLAASWVASQAAGKAANTAGASPEAQRFLANLAGTVTAVGGSKVVLDSLDVAASAAAKTGRAAILATKLRTPTIARVAEATAKAGIHAPIEVLDAGTPSTVQLPPGSGPPETLTDIIKTALAPEPPELKLGEGRDRAVPFVESTPAVPPLVAAPLPAAGSEGNNAAIDIAAQHGGVPVDDAGRVLGGYAGPERRRVDTAPPDGVERRLLPADQVRQDLRDNPELVRQADEMRRHADEARNTPAADVAAAHGGVPVDAPEAEVPVAEAALKPTEIKAVPVGTPNQVFKQFKTALTRAQKANDWPGVIREAERFKAYYDDPANPPYPDDWNRWERARDEAELAMRREGDGLRPLAPRTEAPHGERPGQQLDDSVTRVEPGAGHSPDAAGAAEPTAHRPTVVPGLTAGEPAASDVAPPAPGEFKHTDAFTAAVVDAYRALPIETVRAELEHLERLNFNFDEDAEPDSEEDWPDHFPLDALDHAAGPENASPDLQHATARAIAPLQRLVLEREGQQGLPLEAKSVAAKHGGVPVKTPASLEAGEAGRLRKRLAYLQREVTNPKLTGKALAETQRMLTVVEQRLRDAGALPDSEEPLPAGEERPTVKEPDERSEATPTDRPASSGAGGTATPRAPRSRRAAPRGGEEGTRPGAESGAESGSSEGTGESGPVPAGPRPVGGGRRVRADAGRPDASVEPDLYRITDQDAIGTGSVRERITRNFAAIRVVKLLETEKRPATPAEQAMLVKYVGWGGIPRIFEPWKYTDEGEEREPSDHAHRDDDEYWRAQHAALKDLLSEEEYARARNSTQNAHYTSPVVIRAMWDAVRQLGVTKGSALEPSAGVGHFVGLVPDGLRNLTWATVEKDAISAAILAALYPGAYTQHAPFEQAKLPHDHFTLAISNFPFGKIPITDDAFGGPPFLLGRIHNYFPAKNLELLAPGGLLAFITTQGSLDSRDNERVRAYLASKADFLGAIRLPRTAFKGNAGTEVVTDIIFLRKRKAGDTPAHVAPWLKSVRAEFPNKQGEPIEQFVNEYILAHPEMVLGTHSSAGKMRKADTYTVLPSGDLAEQLGAAIRHLPSDVIDITPPKKDLAAFSAASAPEGSRPFEFVVHEGRIGQVTVTGQVEPVRLAPADEARVRALLPVRTAIRAVYDLMAEDAPDAALTKAQHTLTTAYDRFVKAHGAISLPANWYAFREDPDLPLVLSLEDYDDERKEATKAAVFTVRTKRAERRATKADSPQQALTIALSETGSIDLPRIAELLDKPEADAVDALVRAQLIIDTPSGWELPALYLSGNVRVKLEEAKAAAALDARYATAATLLEAALPTPVPAHKIQVRLGSPWVPPDMIDRFIRSIAPNSNLRTTYSASDAAWGLDGDSPASRFETTEADTKTLLLDALNDRRRVVKTPPAKDTPRTVNTKATALVRQKREDLHRAFQAWLLVEDPERREWAVRTYNEKFNAYVEPKIDGSYLTFPGMADYWRDHIADHQRDAIARIVQLGNTLLAHVVGAGKTLAMIGGMMEMKRMGLARKPMMVVPNHLISQAPGQFLSYYPNARVLVMTSDDLSADRRKRITARIASGDWDAVIAPYSAFVRVSMSAEAEATYQRELLDQIEQAILQAWAAEAQSRRGTKRGGEGRTPPSVKRLENTRDRIQKKLDDLAKRPKDDVLTFEQLGVDALFVDEAHSFKNLYFPTRQQAAGIPADNDAQRATDLYLKARYINHLTHNRGLVLATGTPVSNSMAEIYVMQRLLQEQALRRAGIEAFDAWLAQFGNITTETELDPAGTGMTPRARLKKFRNLPVLAAMFRQIADVKMIDDLPDLKKKRPPLKGGEVETVVVPMSDTQSHLLDELLHRSENLDPKDRRADNMPMITTDGRLGFLDMRLLDRRRREDPKSKIAVAAKHIADIYKEHAHHKGTQLVFLDGGTPGSDKPKPFKWAVNDDGERYKRPLTITEQNRGFDLYADLAKKLERLGIPRTQIAFIHDIDKVAKDKQSAARLALFRKVQLGQIRVLIGSTGKMGTGMNVQDRLVALHHIDPAWKPSDIEQRNGRILRQGNLFFKEDPSFTVRILTYVTEGRNKQFGFDAYMWQLNEAKAAIISDFFRGDLAGMANEQADMDLEQTVITAAGLKAVATGNPAVVALTKAEADLERLRNVYAGWQDDHRDAEINVGWMRGLLDDEVRKDARRLATLAAVTAHETGTTLVATIGGAEVEGQVAIGEAILAQARERTTETKAHIGEFSLWTRPESIGTVRGLAATIERSGKSEAEPVVVLRHPDATVPRYGFTASDDEDPEYKALRFSLTTPSPEGVGGLEWRSPTGLMQSVMSHVNGLNDKDSNIGYYRDRVARYDAVLNAPFEQQAELDAAQAKVEELQAQLGQAPGHVVEQDEVEGGPEAMEIEEPRGPLAQSTVVPGLGAFAARDVEPGFKAAFKEVEEAQAGVRAVWAPASASPRAETMAAIMRPNLALRRQRTARAQKAMRALEVAWDKMPRAAQLAFAMAVDEGHVDALPEWQRQVATLLAGINSQKRREANALGGKVGFIEHYFPREWVQPGKVRAFVMRALYGKQPLQGRAGFKKARSRDKETGDIFSFRAMHAAGFEPVSYNPITVHLRKWLEMDKWIAARRILLEGKRFGVATFVKVGEKPPEGWRRFPESFGTVYGPPIIPVKEAYDAGLMEALHRFAVEHGITMVRRLNLGGQRWGYHVRKNDRSEIHSKFGGPEGVLMHEIGHALDHSHGLGVKIGLAQASERHEEINFSETPSKVAKELRALADLRVGNTASKHFKSYVRQRSEVIANLVHAFLYAPDLARQVAPNAYWALYNLAKDTPDLRGLLDIQKARSLRFGVNVAEAHIEGRVIKGYYYGHPDAVRLMEHHLSPGLRGNALFNLYRRAGNLLNQVQLGLSLFHLVMTSIDDVVGKSGMTLEHLTRGEFKEAAKKAVLIPVAPIADVIRGDRLLRQFYERDATFSTLTGVADAVARGGGGVGWDNFWHESAPERFLQAFRSVGAEAKAGNYPGAALRASVLPYRALTALIELQAKPIMEWWVPRLKLAAYMDLYRMEVRDLGKVPDELELRKAAGKAWDTVDNWLGELIYDNLFWHGVLKDAGMASIRALGWTLGTVRGVFGAVPGQLRNLGLMPGAGGGGGMGKPPMRLRNTGSTPGPDGGPDIPIYASGRTPWLTHDFARLLSMLFWVAVFGALYQYLHTGLKPGEDEDGHIDPSLVFRDLYFPRTGGTKSDGTPERASLPSYAKELYAFLKHPIVTASHKAHPMLALTYDVVVKNEDYFGTEVSNRDDPWMQQLKDVFSFIGDQYQPITVRTFQDRRTRRGETGVGAVESFFGVGVAPATVTRSDAEEYLHSILPPMHRTKAEAAKASARRDLRAAYQDHDAAAGTKAIQEGNLSRRSILLTARSARKDALQRSFDRTTLPQAIKTYELATPEERGELQPLLARKWHRLYAGVDPGEKVKVADAFKAAIKLPVVRRAPAPAAAAATR